MIIYKTVNDFKRNLPEVLERISFLKKERIPLCQYVIRELRDLCIDDAVYDTNVVDKATYNNALAELFRAQLELKYLSNKIKTLPDYKHYFL